MIHFLIWMPGGWELLVIFLIALLLFGSRLPEVAKSMGKAINEFKKGLSGVEKDINNDDDARHVRPPDDDNKI